MGLGKLGSFNVKTSDISTKFGNQVLNGSKDAGSLGKSIFEAGLRAQAKHEAADAGRERPMTKADNDQSEKEIATINKMMANASLFNALGDASSTLSSFKTETGASGELISPKQQFLNRMLDGNGNGVIDGNDLSRLDRSGDGVINGPEIQSIMRKESRALNHSDSMERKIEKSTEDNAIMQPGGLFDKKVFTGM